MSDSVPSDPSILPSLVEAGLLKEHYIIAWDGGPSMSGQPHQHHAGDFPTIEEARSALANLPSVRSYPERNYRIEREYRSDPDRVR